MQPSPFQSYDLALCLVSERKGRRSSNNEEDLVGASAEDFFASVPDNSIDTVVTTLVPCSVHDQGRVVAEIARVLKPGGSFLLLEHMAAHPFTLDR